MQDASEPSLSSAQQKLQRGIEHVRTLREETGAFEQSGAYEPRVESDFRSSKEVEYVVYADQRQAPPPHWPLVAGEAIQNLRAALDHAVYAHTNSRSSSFPIFNDPCEFQVTGRPRIKGVPKAVRTLIEEAQPYKHFPPRPSRDPLALLSSLANADKHRTLTTLASVVRFPYIGWSGWGDADEDVELDWPHPPTPGTPLSDGAELMRFTVRAKAKGADMSVDPRFTFQVGITGRPDLPLLPLADTLHEVARRVFEVVTEVETGQPSTAYLQYPLA